MKFKKGSWGLMFFVTAVASFLVNPAIASGGIKESSNVVCAVMNVVACVEDKGCTQGSANSFELPEFIIVDGQKKVLRAAYESGHKAVSPVKNQDRSGDHLILQGVEHGRGWSLAIDTKTGNMSGSGVGDAVSFLVFGSCTSI